MSGNGRQPVDVAHDLVSLARSLGTLVATLGVHAGALHDAAETTVHAEQLHSCALLLAEASRRVEAASRELR